MKLYDMRTKITIRHNEPLKRLHERCKGDLDVVIQDLLDRLTKIKGIYLNDTELCGMMLPDVLHECGSTLTSFVNDNFGSATFELLETMSGIQIWGLGDCENCGCEMEPKETRIGINSTWKECTNCGTEENCHDSLTKEFNLN